jgi:hypothetical protein
VFRKDLDKEDILKEPLSIYFKSLMTFSESKQDKKRELIEKQQPALVQSHANIVSNMMIYNYENN